MVAKPKDLIDYDSDSVARKNLLTIVDEAARPLYVYEVAWILSMSPSAVYSVVPRARTKNAVRFDAQVVRELKKGMSQSGDSSLKITNRMEKISLIRPAKGRQGKADICL